MFRALSPTLVYRDDACFDAVPGVRHALTEYPAAPRGLGGARPRSEACAAPATAPGGGGLQRVAG